MGILLINYSGAIRRKNGQRLRTLIQVRGYSKKVHVLTHKDPTARRSNGGEITMWSVVLRSEKG